MTEKTFLTFGDRDDFNRKPIAEKIIKLLESDIDVSPLLIDGDWGTGKSEFCQKLINLMDKEKYHLVYVDAFKTDYMEEPLLALLAEIIKTCTLGEKTEKQVERRKELIKVLASVAKFGVKTVLKAGINFLLRQNVEELSEEWKGAVEEPIKELAEKTIEATTEALLKEQVEAEKNIKALQDCLKEIAKDKPIIIFIDELDRCRPDYAIDMLEIIKHVFEIDKIKIVLVANMKVIRLAVDHRYGHGVNSYIYLDKFIKYKITLADSFTSTFTGNDVRHNSCIYLDYLVSNSKILSIKNNCQNASEINNGLVDKSIIYALIDRNGLSLRDMEIIVRNIEIYHELNKDEIFSILTSILYTFAISLYSINPKLLLDLAKGSADIIDIIGVLGEYSDQLFHLENDRQGIVVAYSRLFCLNKNRILYVTEYDSRKNDMSFSRYIEKLLSLYREKHGSSDGLLIESLRDYLVSGDTYPHQYYYNIFQKVYEDLILFLNDR
ncbi:P-loop NTPase fold protein [Cardiobacterium hominis]|uniref:KAP family P-loop NTPase fold protein n=1 Tax=Cardiobacterium hominis TaxID=2718 RepID=UPI0028F009BB|nr:P-loop NTPase fold protein [Cardiobacterium hominis]